MSEPRDPASFSAFYREARPSCIRAVVVTVCDLHRTEELVDEAFARAYERWDRVGHHPRPEAWIVRTAVNLSRQRWHRRRRETERTPRPSHVPPPPEPADASLLEAVLELPERQREVVAYRVILQASTNETAEALGIAPSTVTVHLHRAMRTLREDTRLRALVETEGVD